jgi:hypothetical protein
MPILLKNDTHRALLRRIAPFWVACLIVGSLLPGGAKEVIGSSRQEDMPVAKVSGAISQWKHRTFHIVGFGATTLLFLCLATQASEEVLSAAGLFGLGVALEFTQRWLFNNRLETDDMRDDGYGILAMYGFVLAWQLAQRVKEKQANNG